MRLSVDRNDSGYQAWAKVCGRWKPTVYVDGVRIAEVFTADTDAGYVLAADLDHDGKLRLNEARDEVLRRELRGVVTIELEPR
jgi:hypothetical protein